MKKDSKFVAQFFYPPMESGRFVNAPVAAPTGDTNFFRAKKKLRREECWECEGTGMITIYPLVEIPCQACRGKGYFLELHIGFETPSKN